MKRLLALAASLSLAAPTAFAQEPVTSKSVETALREYVTCKYAGDDECVRSRAHHDIARRTVSNTYWGAPSDEWVRTFNHDVLQFYGTTQNRTKLDNPESGRCEITVYDVEANTAAGVVVMEDVVDFVHLALFDGRWVIADSSVIILPEAGAEPTAKTSDDEHAITEVVRNYCVGFYEIDGEKVQSTCHPSLSKRTINHYGDQSGFDFFTLITWEEIRILGETFNKHWNFDPETARCEVEVYEIRGNIALAKLTGAIWFDYLQLMKVNGEWTIVNILYETLPEERWETAR